MSVAIEADRLGKVYRRVSAGYQLRTLKSALLRRSLTVGLSEAESVRALDDVSFRVERGEAFGVIGGNGSGKSTLLKIVAGLLRPSSGSIEVDGRVAALIELGAGFHPEISGRENIFINGAVLGLSKRQIEERFDRIVAFSGLEEFIDEPVKNYSSGMYVRLGFSVAIHTDPEILLVDEVLSVGDEAFGRRCLRRIEEFLAEGRTLLVVSHSLGLIEHLCSRTMWLERGLVREIGEPRRVIDSYREAVAEEEALQQASAALEQGDDPKRRWGSRRAEIVEGRLLVGSEDEERESFHLTSGEAATFELRVRAAAPLDDFVFGVAVSTPRGAEVWGTNTDLAGFEPVRLEGEGTVRLHCPALRLAPGEYDVDLAVHGRDGTPYDYRRGCFRVTVSSSERGVGVYFPRHRWSASGGVEWRGSEPRRERVESDE